MAVAMLRVDCRNNTDDTVRIYYGRSETARRRESAKCAWPWEFSVFGVIAAADIVYFVFFVFARNTGEEKWSVDDENGWLTGWCQAGGRIAVRRMYFSSRFSRAR